MLTLDRWKTDAKIVEIVGSLEETTDRETIEDNNENFGGKAKKPKRKYENARGLIEKFLKGVQ